MFNYYDRRDSCIAPDLLRNLYRQTYFDKRELHALYNMFGGEDSICIRQIMNSMKADAKIEPFLQIIFTSIEPDNRGYIEMGNFVPVLSDIARGSKVARAELVFRLCDLANTGYVKRPDLLAIASIAHELFQHFDGFGYANIGTPEEAVSDIFGKSTKMKFSKKKFLMRAEFDPDIYRCFGLFDYFYYTLVRPIEDKVHKENSRPPKNGELYTHKRIPLAKWYSASYCEVRDGFMITYNRGPTQTRRPTRVICLFGTLTHISEHHATNTHHTRMGRWIHGHRHKADGGDTKFSIKTSSGEFSFGAPNEARTIEWVSTIRANARGGYQFQSFAPPRPGISVKMFVNACSYFSDLAESLLGAKKDIYIAGWWLSPKLYLKREQPLDKKYRLDKILERAAKAGVRVYILVWDESNVGVNLGSRWTKVVLEALHRNICVIRHPRFTMTWSHHQKAVVIDQGLAYIGGIDLCYGRYDEHTYPLVDVEGTVFPGEDYGNSCLLPTTIFPNFASRRPTPPKLDRETQHRLPWHDVSMLIDGQAARDVAINFIQRWNFAKQDNRSGVFYPNIVPRAEVPSHSAGSNICQVVRSVSEWSAGQPVEDSIYKAYINLINTANHFVYIQNQFFISSTSTEKPKNKIALALLRRIRRAIYSNEVFRVIVLLPIHSEGFLADKRTSVLVEWNLRTINAIQKDLKAEFPNVDINEYIVFNALRTWAQLGDHVVSEQIYVHSKVMIVDDQVALIGSANINDRSMRGSRDSELGAVLRDTELIPSVMNSVPVKVGKSVYDLRVQLWRLHLGLTPNQPEHDILQDPVSDTSFNSIWRGISAHNSRIYSEVFGNRLPENCITIEELDRESRLQHAEVSSKLLLLRGFLIDYPFKLLQNDITKPANPPKWFTHVFL